VKKKSTINTKNSFFAKWGIINLLGQGLIVIVGILAIPILINGLGTERFGILTLAWAVTGYFSIFDLGIGRAMTKIIAERLGRGELKDIPSVVWTGILFMLIIGLIGTILLYAVSPYLVEDALTIPIKLQGETIKAFFLLAFTIPIVITATSLRGILEAYQRFDLMNFVRIPLGVLTFVSPLIVLQFSKNIIYIVASLVAIRFIEWLVNLVLCFIIIPSLREKIRVKIVLLKELMSFGGWITVSNVAGPLIIYLDRFLIGSLISLTAVTYYTAPFELNSRLMIIPGAIVGVLFSAFSATYEQDRDQSTKMFFSGLKYTYISLFPIILLIVVFAYEGLELWLGKEFALESTSVLQLLAFGSILNCLTYVPSALVQAAGRPDLTGKLHILELPFYLIALFLLVKFFGIEGAAFAYVLRVSFDTIILLIMAIRLLSVTKSIKRLFVFIIGTIPLIIISAFLPISLFIKCLFTFLTIFTFLILGWKIILDQGERNFIINYIKDNIFNKKIGAQ
jgi:O-antigen/teichoic acid export membrane protein